MKRTLLIINIGGILASLVWVFLEGFMSASSYVALFAAFGTLVPVLVAYRREHKILSKVNEIISTLELKRDYPFLKRIGIIGVSSVGKTTLAENICRIPNKGSVTQGAWAYISNLSSSKNKFVAILDAAGQSPSLQIDMALESDILLVVFDHNVSSDSNVIDKKRIESHKTFIDLLIDRFKNSSNNRLKTLYLIMNKRDLWQKNENRKSEIKQVMDNFEQEFKSVFSTIEIHRCDFSNSITSDCTKIVNILADKI